VNGPEESTRTRQFVEQDQRGHQFRIECRFRWTSLRKGRGRDHGVLAIRIPPAPTGSRTEEASEGWVGGNVRVSIKVVVDH
jgi:hypothetical protein